MVGGGGQRKITYCVSSWAKLKGLIAKSSLEEGEYYVFPSCSAIHTFGMRFAIDVIFCNKTGDILKYYRKLPPNRLVFSAKAFFTIELVSNNLLSQEQLRIIVNDCLSFDESRPNRHRWI